MTAKKKTQEEEKTFNIPVVWIVLAAAGLGFAAGVYRHELASFFKEKAPVVKENAQDTAAVVIEKVDEAMPKIKKDIESLRDKVESKAATASK